MSEKPKYSAENIRALSWVEHIRLRPIMYIGSVNVKGFTEMLKGIISSVIASSNTNHFMIELIDDLEGKIRFNNLNAEFVNHWGHYEKNPRNPFWLNIAALNALSEKFSICFLDADQDIIGVQYYEKGKLISRGEIDKISCANVAIDFLLDRTIWEEAFKWNITYLTHHLREFAYLKRTKFEVKYKIENEDCREIYHFKNGLKDRIDIEILNGLGKSYFETDIDTQIDDLHIEAAFAFRYYSVDAPYLKSYANDYLTFEHGTHVDGLLKGLTYGVMKYFQKHQLTDAYKISEKGIKENLVGAINVKLDAPVFSGCVKNKLSNPEIIEPIANYVAELLFKKIKADEAATQEIISKFEI